MPYITISTGLTIKVPTNGTRNWGTEVLNNNFAKIAAHDHTGSGKGLNIGTTAIANAAVTAAKLASDVNRQVLARLTVAAGPSNTVTETDLLNYSLAGNSLGTDRRVMVRLAGRMANASGLTASLTLRIYFGSTVYLAPLAHGLTSLAYARRWILEVAIQGRAATNAQTIDARFSYASPTGAGETEMGRVSTSGAEFIGMNDTANKDSTAAQDVRVTAEWGTADASISLQARSGLVTIE